MKTRSLLFVPAKEKLLNKLGVLNADIYIIDLEDSIEVADKDDALKRLVDKLSLIDTNRINIMVRLNKERYMLEASTLDKFNVGFMLPKFELTADYAKSIDIWSNHSVVALIETPKGIINLREIAHCSFVDALAFGAEDYTAKVGMTNDIQFLQYQKSRLITYAKAFEKKVYDTPSFQLNDEEKFMAEVCNAKALGFDGKMAINPKHIEYINASFADCDLNVMQYIVDEYEKLGQAVAVIMGKVYEKMHIAHMKKIIKENKGD